MTTAVQSTNSATAAGTSTSSSTTAASSTVTKDMFLKLLVAQIKNQEPLNPVPKGIEIGLAVAAGCGDLGISSILTA